MSNEQLIIGIDAGTSMTKAVAFSLNGSEVTKASRSTRLHTPDNWIEADMDFVWEDVSACLREIADTVRKQSLGVISAIGITATGDGTWMMDTHGLPTRAGIMWCDGRSQAYVNAWHEDGTARKAYGYCGTSVFPGTQAAQIRWLMDNDADALEKAAVVFHEKDWLLYKLTGTISTDATDQCLTNIDLKTATYDPELLSVFGVELQISKFPEIRPTSENAAPILETVAHALSLPAGIPVAAGPMDVSAHALGVGAIRARQASSVLGTAGLHQIIMDDTNISMDNMTGMTLCHCKPNSWIRLVAAMVATPNLDWVLDTTGVRDGKTVDYSRLERELKEIPPGSAGVIYQPYLAPGGERGPFVNTTAKAGFFGISQSHTKYHLIRAVYEGVAFSMRDCYEHMPIEPYEILLSGGGANSAFWSQMVCDIVGKRIVIPDGSEYGARGAAINAGVAAGIFESYESAVETTIKYTRKFEPNMTQHETYSRFYELYRNLYTAQVAIWKQRADILAE